MNRPIKHFFQHLSNTKKLACSNFINIPLPCSINWPIIQFYTVSLAIFLVLTSYKSLAQQTKFKSSRTTIVVGKVLSAEDSASVKQLFFEALRQKVANNTPAAINHLKQLIAIDPANDAALYELGIIYTKQNNTSEAEHLLKKATTVNPDNKWYWMLLEDIYVKTENASQLNFVYDELIRLNPEEQAYYLAKANNLVAQDKLKEASTIYENIQNRFGSSDEITQIREQIYLQNGESDKAIALLEKQIQENPKEGNNYAYLATIYSKLGNRDKAISVLEKGKQIDPTNTLISLNLAENYIADNQLNNAFTELKIAFADRELTIETKINIVLSFFLTQNDSKTETLTEELIDIILRTHPDNPKAYAMYGDMLFQKQKYTEALAAYKSGLEINRQMYPLWEQLLRIEIIQNNFEQAIKDGETALSMFPNQASLYLFTAIAYSRTGMQEQAISYLQAAINLKPTEKPMLVQIYATLGDSYNYLKQYDKSDEAYEKALEIDSSNSYVLNNYAYFLSEREIKLEKAANMAKRSIELDPNNPSSEDTYAWILFKLKKYKEARVWIEKALRNDQSNSSTLLEHYGDILYHLNEKKQAIEQWKKAKTAGSNDSKQLEIKINEEKYVK